MALSLYERKIRENRRDLLRLDNRARSELERAYVQGRQQVRADLKRATSDLADLPADSMFDRRGRFTDRGQVQWRAERLGSLERQIDDELARLTRTSEQVILQGQGQAARMGAQQAAGLIEAAAPSLEGLFSRLQIGAIEESVGMLSNNSPLRTLLNDQGLDAGRQARDVLTNAVAQGTGPRQVAKELAAILRRSEWRAEQTARNAMLDSHRLASLRTYAENASVLSGWYWISALGPRSCLACVNRHGSEWPLSQQFMPRHVACRCSAAPIVRGSPSPLSETGPEWFDRQPAETQRAMMGNRAFDLFQRGEVALRDFEGYHTDSVWGPSFYERSLREVLSRRGGRRAA